LFALIHCLDSHILNLLAIAGIDRLILFFPGTSVYLPRLYPCALVVTKLIDQSLAQSPLAINTSNKQVNVACIERSENTGH
jgi:hypothetical protein